MCSDLVREVAGLERAVTVFKVQYSTGFEEISTIWLTEESVGLISTTWLKKIGLSFLSGLRSK